LALFFVLQRILYKWRGENLSRSDRHWKLFRELFLQVCDLEIPGEFIHQGEPSYRRIWQNIYLGRFSQTRAFISHIHKSSGYT
jgi:hypothetical protein